MEQILGQLNQWWDRYHIKVEMAFGLLGVLALAAVFDPGIVIAILIVAGIVFVIAQLFRTPKESKAASESPPVLNLKRPHWGPDVLGMLNRMQFRTVCSEYFLAKGYHTKFMPETSSDDVDIYLFKHPKAPRPLGIIQCQAGVNSIVGKDRMQQLQKVMQIERIPLGICATPGSFSQEAQEMGNNKQLQMLDGARLEALLSKLAPSVQVTMFSALIDELEDAPSCPRCGSGMHRMDLVTHGKNKFWACNNYPECRHTLEV